MATEAAGGHGRDAAGRRAGVRRGAVRHGAARRSRRHRRRRRQPHLRRSSPPPHRFGRRRRRSSRSRRAGRRGAGPSTAGAGDRQRQHAVPRRFGQPGDHRRRARGSTGCSIRSSTCAATPTGDWSGCSGIGAGPVADGASPRIDHLHRARTRRRARAGPTWSPTLRPRAGRRPRRRRPTGRRCSRR